jgi:hypothetical protein
MRTPVRSPATAQTLRRLLIWGFASLIVLCQAYSSESRALGLPFSANAGERSLPCTHFQNFRESHWRARC